MTSASMRVRVLNYRAKGDHIHACIDSKHCSHVAENRGELDKVQIFDHASKRSIDISEHYGETGYLVAWRYDGEHWFHYATSPSFVFADTLFFWNLEAGTVWKGGEEPPVPPPPSPPPDARFTTLAAIFAAIAAKFDWLADLLKGVPALGRYLSFPFYYIADRFWEASDVFGALEAWWTELRDWMESLIDFDEIRTWMEDTFAILAKTSEELYKWIEPYVPKLPDWVPTSPGEFKSWLFGMLEDSIEWFFKSTDEFKNWLFSAFEGSIEWFFKSTDDFKNWLFGAFEGSIEWFFKSTDDFKNWLFGAFEGSIGWFFKSTDDFKNWLFDAFEDSLDWFFKSSDDFISGIQEHLPPIPTPETIGKWLGDAIGDLVEAGLNFVGAHVDRFKKLIWDTVEKVLEKL